MTFDLTGRSALVTGVGSADGIGFACARLLAQLGASVAITSRSPRAHQRAAELRAAVDARVTSYDGDLTDEEWVRSLVASVVDDHGGLHILVNNAGMVSVVDGDSGSGDIFTTVPQSWQAAFHRNVTTAYLLTRAA